MIVREGGVGCTGILAPPAGRDHRDTVPGLSFRMASISILGVPLDLGAARRGVEMGPSAVRLAQLASRLEQLGHDVIDTGDVAVPTRETLRFGSGHGLPPDDHRCLPRGGAPHRRHRSRGPDPARARRRSLTRCRIGRGRCQRAVGAQPAARRALDRCARRPQHPREHAERQRARHASGTPARTRRPGDGGDRAAGTRHPAGARGDHRRARSRSTPSERTRGRTASRSTRCATSTNVACGRCSRRRLRGSATAPTACTYRSISISSTRRRRREWARPFAGAPRIVRRISPWKHVWDTGRVVSMDLVEVNPVLDRFNHTAELAVGLMSSAFGKRII